MAWAFGLAGFDPVAAEGLLPGDLASPFALFALQVVFATFLTGIVLSLVTVGEELGWRGYMLTRMVDAGVPRPVLTGSFAWAVWHLPLVFGVGYATGPSAVLLVVSITAAGFVISRLRLETGSPWPAVVFHGVWNSVIQTAFDPATAGAGARLWWANPASWWCSPWWSPPSFSTAARGPWSVSRRRTVPLPPPRRLGP